jgi:hypothetical protein
LTVKDTKWERGESVGAVNVLGSGVQLSGDSGERLTKSADIGFEVPVCDSGLRGLTHACGLLWTGEDAAESGGEGVDVANGEDEAFDAVGDEIRVRAYFVGENDGTA